MHGSRRDSKLPNIYTTERRYFPFGKQTIMILETNYNPKDLAETVLFCIGSRYRYMVKVRRRL